MLAAYQSAGLIIPRVAADQYNSGSHVPVAEAQPGDLIFWASHPNNPVTIEHVAMYLGNNKVVEAPDTGDVVKTVPIWTNGLVPQATRPGS
jgi:cell wall-associated NlpC family hydrolase